MNVRPDCVYCKKPESAMMILGGQFACGQCIILWDTAQKQEARRMVEEQLARIRNGN